MYPEWFINEIRLCSHTNQPNITRYWSSICIDCIVYRVENRTQIRNNSKSDQNSEENFVNGVKTRPNNQICCFFVKFINFINFQEENQLNNTFWEWILFWWCHKYGNCPCYDIISKLQIHKSTPFSKFLYFVLR